MDGLHLNISSREKQSRGELKKSRIDGMIPGIVYGKSSDGQVAENLVFISEKELRANMQNASFYTQVLSLKGGDKDDKDDKVVVRELQRHPWKNQVIHIDFMRIDDTKELTLKAPIHFLNEDKCVGVRTGGGAISHLVNDIEITCLPKDIPKFIEIDLEHLELNHSVHISELKLPENVMLSQKIREEAFDRPVVSVSVRKVVEVETPTQTVADEAIETEGGEVKTEGDTTKIEAKAKDKDKDKDKDSSKDK